MTIQECIQKTVEYLDGVYKDGPHFFLTDDTSANQMKELIRIHIHYLDTNLSTLADAYIYGIENEVFFDDYGWLSLPKIPEEKIEVLRADYGKTEVTIKLAEANGKWLWVYRIDGANCQYGSGSITYNSPCNSTRINALITAIEAIESLISKLEGEEDKGFSEQAKHCIKEIQECEQQGKLF